VCVCVYRKGSHKITVGANDFPLPAQLTLYLSLTLFLSSSVRVSPLRFFIYADYPLNSYILFPFQGRHLNTAVTHERRRCHSKTTMRVYPKVNYIPLRRFSYPFGVSTTMRDFVIYTILYIIRAHTNNSLQTSKDLFVLFYISFLLPQPTIHGQSSPQSICSIFRKQ